MLFFTRGFASLFVYPTQLFALLYIMEPENDDVEVQSFPLPTRKPLFWDVHSSGDFWVQIWGFHASNFEAVESLSSTHVDCRNQQASEVFHGNIPLNCEILRTLDTNIFHHILINWMVVLPCCVDPQLTTSHVPWGPPLHFISHHPHELNFFHISSSQWNQNAAWMDYDTTCILAREIRLNEIRALCSSAEIREFHQVTRGVNHRIETLTNTLTSVVWISHVIC